MRPTSKPFSALLSALAVCSSCAVGQGQTAISPTRTGMTRRAPGVIETLALPLPEPARSGDSRDQLLVLRAPAVADAARKTVRDFFRAIVAGAPERFEPLFTAQAFVDTTAGRQPAVSFWHARITQLDYAALAGQLLFRETDLQTFRAQDLARLPASRRLPLELAEDEVALRVPIRVSWAGRVRLFGDELIFRLQPIGAGFEIAEISEDFRSP